MNLEDATAFQLANFIDDKKENEVEGIVDGVLVITDPEITTDSYDEIIETANEIIENTPEGEIPFDPKYIGEIAQTCPICGATFTEDYILQSGDTCPICLEQPEAFIMIGRLGEENNDIDEEIEELVSREEMDEDSINDKENNLEDEEIEEDIDEEDIDEEETSNLDLASKQIKGKKLEEDLDKEQNITLLDVINSDDAEEGNFEVYDNETDEVYSDLSIFNKVTDKGIEKFKEVLSLPVDISEEGQIVINISDYEDIDNIINKIHSFINAYAGYISKDVYTELFAEPVENKIEESNNLNNLNNMIKDMIIAGKEAGQTKNKNITETILTIKQDNEEAKQMHPIELLNIINEEADNIYKHNLNENVDIEEKQKGEYLFLGRLQSDCEYFLNYGNGSEKHLWAGNIEDQIKEMRETYNKIVVKPQWITMEKIDEYEKQMLDYNKQDKDKLEEANEKDLLNQVMELGKAQDEQYKKLLSRIQEIDEQKRKLSFELFPLLDSMYDYELIGNMLSNDEFSKANNEALEIQKKLQSLDQEYWKTIKFINENGLNYNKRRNELYNNLEV